MSAEPTDADRLLALGVIHRWDAEDTGTYRDLADKFAQALADQRARYEAVADDLQINWSTHASEYAAERIRAVGQ